MLSNSYFDILPMSDVGENFSCLNFGAHLPQPVYLNGQSLVTEQYSAHKHLQAALSLWYKNY